MAVADYRLCDVCGGKAFYDAELRYEDARDDGGVPYRIAGEEQEWGNVLGYVGDWAVICVGCARTHRTRIEKLIPVESVGGVRGSS